MGDPKLPRRIWKKPKRPLNYELKEEELKTLGVLVCYINKDSVSLRAWAATLRIGGTHSRRQGLFPCHRSRYRNLRQRKQE